MNTDTLSLTLPKVGSKSKRIRLPRPPKFSRSQKIFLFFSCVMVIVNVLSGSILDPSGFLITGVLLLQMRTIILEAVRGRRYAPGESLVILVLILASYALLMAGH